MKRLLLIALLGLSTQAFATAPAEED